VRRSPIHGRGVFALRDIPAGTQIVEYRGEIISWPTARARYAAMGLEGQTYYFDRGDGTVIDGLVGGNSARYLNHSCEPNCEAINENGRIRIHAVRHIPSGSELLLDYLLQVDHSVDQGPDAYRCACEAAACRSTMLAPPS
jgi:SET domain-containing protein